MTVMDPRSFPSYPQDKPGIWPGYCIGARVYAQRGCWQWVPSGSLGTIIRVYHEFLYVEFDDYPAPQGCCWRCRSPKSLPLLMEPTPLTDYDMQVIKTGDLLRHSSGVDFMALQPFRMPTRKFSIDDPGDGRPGFLAFRAVHIFDVDEWSWVGRPPKAADLHPRGHHIHCW